MLKQTINFVKPEEQIDKTRLFHFRRLLQTSAIGLTLLTLWTVAMLGNSLVLMGQSQHQSEQLALVKEKKDQQQALIQDSQIDGRLELAIKMLANQVESKKQFLNFLSQRAQGKKFSSFLFDLESIKLAQMQIDNIHISQSGYRVDISGLAVSSQVVTRWLSLLQKSKAYDGLSFERFSIEHNNQGPYLFFEVKSRYEQSQSL